MVPADHFQPFATCQHWIGLQVDSCIMIFLRTFITFHIQIPYVVNQDYIKLVPILAKYAMVPVQIQFSFLAGGGYTVQILDLSLLRWLTLVLQSKHDFLDF